MKYLKSFKLFEAVNENNYYYFTNNIKSILTMNKILLSSHLGTVVDRSNKFFFLSVSRSPDASAGYGRFNYSRIVLDKDKLKSDFKLISYDYWQDKNPEKLPAFKNLQNGNGDMKSLQREINMRNEFEDRLISDKPNIDNVSKYIKRIDILFPEQRHINTLDNNIIYEEINLCKKLNIPVFVYENKNDMTYSKNSITDTIKYVETEEKEYESPYKDRDTFSHYNELVALFFYDKKYLDNYDLFEHDIKKYLNDNKLDIVIDIHKTFDRMRTLGYSGGMDMIYGIEADLHTYFKNGNNGKFRDVVGFFIKQMKKLGINSLRELKDLKINGLRPKHLPKKDWSAIYQLSKVEYNYDTEKYDTYIPVPNEDLFKDLRNFYYNIWKYNGQFDNEDFDKIYDIDKNNKPISMFINYLFNKYTAEKAIDKIESSGYSDYDKLYNYKVIKIK